MQHQIYPLLKGLFVLCLFCLPISACEDDENGAASAYASDFCNLNPRDCEGGIGTLCNNGRDCQNGLFCCTDNKNCGKGMCTAECKKDVDCPGSMLCEHNMCFYTCNSDLDCAEEMSCEHGNTICEWD